jgi:hypothetical protein
MSAHFSIPGRRNRKWVSVTLLTSYPAATVYEVYRIPVINGEVLYHLYWLHKVLPSS